MATNVFKMLAGVLIFAYVASTNMVDARGLYNREDEGGQIFFSPRMFSHKFWGKKRNAPTKTAPNPSSDASGKPYWGRWKSGDDKLKNEGDASKKPYWGRWKNGDASAINNLKRGSDASQKPYLVRGTNADSPASRHETQGDAHRPYWGRWKTGDASATNERQGDASEKPYWGRWKNGDASIAEEVKQEDVDFWKPFWSKWKIKSSNNVLDDDDEALWKKYWGRKKSIKADVQEGFNSVKSNLAKSDMVKNFIDERKRKSSDTRRKDSVVSRKSSDGKKGYGNLNNLLF